MDYLTNPTTAVQTISALGVVLAAFISAYSARQTLRMLKTMRQANESNSRPVVSVSLEDRPENVSFVDLALTNAGNGLARDIKFELIAEDPDISGEDSDERHISDLRAVQRGVKTLAPHEIRRYWLCSMMGIDPTLMESDIRVRLTYYNSDKSKQYSDVFELDFASLPESRATEDPQYKMATELEGVRKQLATMNRK